MRTVRLLFAAIWLAAQAVALQAAEPANPKTGAKARDVLNYLESLPQRTDKRMLSGQFSGSGGKASTAPCKEIYDKTGHWPALIGLDYSDFSPKGHGFDCKTVNRMAIEYARHGGLVTLMPNLYNPANPNGGGLRDKGVDLKQLLAPGGEVRARWIKEMDALAAGLQELQAAGVVVLWRPFHEMNGGWFWWGAKDPDTFIKVWRQMFDYFSETKGLNNLLWVYSPNHGGKTAAYYPGDRYVDIVGLDVYTDFVDPQHVQGYEAVAKLPKPFAFTEFGPHDPIDPPGDYDYRRFLEGVRTHYPEATFFLAWGWRWGLGQNRFVKEFLDDPWMANREDVPQVLTGRTN